MKKYAIILFFSLFVTFPYCGKESSKTYPEILSQMVIPRPEFPRPDLQRDEWVNLNGHWYFRFDPYNLGKRDRWFSDVSVFSQEIVVPFPWQSPLSGLGSMPEDIDDYPVPFLPVREKNRIGWYMRYFYTPPWVDSGKRVFLNFGAVDWKADVWVNGRYAGSHEGGYTPFSLDITDLLLPTGFRNVIVVRVYDPGSNNDELIPVGKQGDFWYTPCSGIWQSAWLEARGKVYFENYRVVSSLNSGNVTIIGKVENLSGEELYRLCIRVYDETGEYVKKCESVFIPEGESEVITSFTLENPVPWSPDNPHLYRFVWTLEEKGEISDRIRGYFGVREIKIDWAPGHSPADTSNPQEQYKYIYLNGKPVFIRGILDQGYNPWGIYTYPSVATMERELKYIKALGFNTIRIHIKGPDPYKLYFADKLGLFVIYDIPTLKMFANGEDPVGRENYLKTLSGLVERDRNHPSIIWWVLFNEDWGLLRPERVRYNTRLQKWVESVVQYARTLDPGRPVEDISAGGLGAFDHMDTDIQTWHFYIKDYNRLKRHLEWITDNTYPGSTEIWIPGFSQAGQPLINSEFNGIDVYGGNLDVSWYFHWQVNMMRMYPKIQGYVFTQLTDVEYEHNGLMKYNLLRKISGYEEFGVSEEILNSPEFLVIDYPPVTTFTAGSVVRIPVYFSNMSDSSSELYLYVKISGWDIYGNKIVSTFSVPYEFQTEPYSLTFVGEIPVSLPIIPTAGAIIFQAEDDRGNLVAANYINFLSLGNGGYRDIITFDPSFYSSLSWDGGYYSGRGIFYGKGKGFVEYTVPVTVSFSGFHGAELLMEISSGGKDIASRQTSDDMVKSRVTISINGYNVKSMDLGEYADSRGFLSYLNCPRLAGSYGLPVKIELGENILQDIEEKKRVTVRLSTDGGGLKVFGKSCGKYPWGITVVFKK